MKKLYLILYFILFSFGVHGVQSQKNEIINTTKTPVAVQQKIIVYPSPATNIVNVLGLMNSKRAHIIITDAYDEKVIQYNWAITKKALSIPVAQLNSGIYIITIISKEQQVQTKFYKK